MINSNSPQDIEQIPSEEEMNNLTIGVILRAHRKFYKKEISDISQDLKIKEKYIDALERDSFAEINSNIYLPGFVESYARILGIKQDVVSKKVRELNIVHSINIGKHNLLNFEDSEARDPDKDLVINAILISLIFFLLLISFNQISSKQIVTTEFISNEINAK